MKFSAPLIAVKNMDIAKDFYQRVLDQKIIVDFGKNVTMSSEVGSPVTFALQEGFAEMVDIQPNTMAQKENNFELYFETKEFDKQVARLEQEASIQYVHKTKEQVWGQRTIRFYDPDGHMIELGEDMEVVVKRYISHGMSDEEVSKKTMFPIPFVQKCRAEMNQ